MRASVQDDRLRAADREPRAVVAEPQDAVPGRRRARCRRRSAAAPPDAASRVSTSLSVPSLSTNASVRPSGLRARPVSRSPSPRSTPIAAGLLSSAASRLLRVCGESSSATPWRASSSARSRSSSASACAPRRCAAAAVASARALPRWSSATSAGDHREDEQRGHAREHHAQAALRAPARAPAVVQERALGRVELGLVAGRPVERGGEARAAVQPAGIARVGVPRARGVAELAVQAPALRVLLEPGAQPRPFAQQRLVRDLDRAVGDRQQPAVGEPGDDLGDALARRARRARSGGARSRRSRPRRRGAAAACAPPPAAPDRARTNASSASRATAPWTPPLRAYAASRRRAPVALAPELEQRRGQQRQRARLALDVRQQRLDELRLDAQADPLRRALDRAPQLVARHRADEHVVGAEQARQLGVGGAAAVEVRAHGEHDDAAAVAIAGGAHERGDELVALRLVLARGEQLLELVDREHAAPLAREPPGRAAERAQRLLAGTDQRLRPVRRCRAGRRPRARAAARP